MEPPECRAMVRMLHTGSNETFTIVEVVPYASAIVLLVVAWHPVRHCRPRARHGPRFRTGVRTFCAEELSPQQRGASSIPTKDSE
jgi:hypothetical protein